MIIGSAAPLRRLSIEDAGPAEPEQSFAHDVRVGLTAERKELPARSLYDAIGSALYEAITLLPEYYLTRAEAAILHEFAGEMLARVGDAEIVELGPGNGAKTRIMIEAALAHQPFVRYRPIDISSSALRALAQSLVAEYDHVAVNAYCGDYRTALLRHPRSAGTTMLVMFLGSSIGNYEPREAARLLRGMVGAMRSCDALLLGTDLKKSRAALELAYNDPGGVSAAFNRNVLARVNRELGGTFDLSKFRFVASYDERRCCIDSFQESLANQTVRIDALGIDVPFASGERIHVESSYKYDAESIAALARDGGFDVSDAWSDAEGRFAVSLLRPVQS